MACRKAAYRAMTEMSEWMQEQQEKANASLEAFEKEQQQFWTPPHVLDGCCMKWLADGREILGHSSSMGGGGAGVVNRLNTKGCDGGCNKDHPRITLDWCDQKEESNDSNSVGGGAAILSHPLDPFLKYFDSLCQQGLAIKISDTNRLEYKLIGFLHTHVEKLKDAPTVPFGYHLVKVSTKALAKSHRAHGRYMQEKEDIEELERRRRRHHQTKRLKRCNEDDEENEKAVADYQYRLDLLEKALDICYSHYSLQEHLDVCDIAWMRLSCKRPLGRMAARLARFRITKQIRLSYSVLIHGMSSLHTWEPEGFLRQRRFFHHTSKVQKEQVQQQLIIPEEGVYLVESSRLPLKPASASEDAPQNVGNDVSSGDKTADLGIASLSPASLKGRCEKSATREAFIPLKSTEHMKDCSPWILWKDDQWGNEQGYGPTVTTVRFERCYLGNLIRVYLEAPSDKGTTKVSISLPERDCLFSTSNTYMLEVARYHIDPFHDSSGVSDRAATIASSSHSPNGRNDDGCNLTYKVISNEKEENAYSTNYNGTFNINSIQFGFKDLLGVYARKKLPKEKEKLQQITNTRPATKGEKSYVKAIAKEAREAPGNSRDFQTMWGW